MSGEQGADAHLHGLESELDRLRSISRAADEQLANLRSRELSILHEGRPSEHQVPNGALTLGAVVSLRDHFEALRTADSRFYEERDRRYSEVNIEREKALKIKETADLAALSLAREIQDYKDEKANNLRDQILATESKYATKDDLKATLDKLETQLAPVLTWMSGQQGRGIGSRELFAWLVGGASVLYVAIRITQGH